MRAFACLSLGGLLILLSVGGFVQAQNIRSSSIDALFITYAVDESTNTITARLTLYYWKGDEDFLWIIPIFDDPNPYAERDYQSLENYVMPNTPPVFDFPPNYCANLYTGQFPYHQVFNPDGTNYYEANAILTSEINVVNHTEILDYLNESGVAVPENVLRAVESYSDEGMSFIVAEVSQDSFASIRYMDLQLSYHSNRIVIPPQLLFNEVQNFPVRVNILADARYVPTNYPQALIDWSEFQLRHAIAEPFNPIAGPDYFADRSNYLSLRNGEVNSDEGIAFYTELAAPTNVLLDEMDDETPYEGYYFRDDIQDTEGVRETFENYAYVTRMYGLMSSNPVVSGIEAPEFAPDATADPVSNIHDVRQFDPLTVWGCSTRTLPDYINTEIPSALPEGRTRYSSYLPLTYLAHPEGWQRSDFYYNDTRMTVIASQEVDETTIEDYLNSEPTPPMLFIQSFSDYYNGDCETYLDIFEDSKSPQYYRCARPVSTSGVSGGTEIIGILTSDDDFAENEAMYRAMVDYPFTFQYRLHPELRHTLALNALYTQTPIVSEPVFIPSTMIGYPEGWLEQTISEQHIVIMPETFDDLNEAPYAYVYPVSEVAEPAIAIDVSFEDRKNNVVDWLVEHFHVDPQTFSEEYLNSCGWNTPVVAFQHNGRTGYIVYFLYPNAQDQPFLLEISAPDEIYDQYQHTLDAMAESVTNAFICG